MICTDLLQTIGTWGLLIVAIITICYGIRQYEAYKAEKRPYISLIKVEIGSNLTKTYLINHPTQDKDVLPDQIVAEDQEVQEKAEEVIVNLFIKNTGPVAAKNVEMTTSLLRSDIFTIKGDPNPKSVINDKTDFRSIHESAEKAEEKATNLVALMPEQEKTEFFMLHRKQWADKYNVWRHDASTNHLYLICKIKYESIKGDQHEYFGVYRLFHPAAWTRMYSADLIKSEVY